MVPRWFRPTWWGGVRLKDYKDLYATGNFSSTMETQTRWSSSWLVKSELPVWVSQGLGSWGFLLDRSHRGWTLSSVLNGFTADGKGHLGRTPIARLQAGPQHCGYGGLNWRGIFTDWEDTDIGLPMNTKTCRNSPLWILPYFLSVTSVAIFIFVQKFCLWRCFSVAYYYWQPF